jgi:outer membrane protein assembly factor BamD (BamD/ComL family)
MRSIFKCLTVVLLVTFAAACSNPHQDALDNIKKAEEITFSETGLVNPDHVDELIAAYESFTNEFPADTLSPDFLFKAGDVAMNTNRSNKAIKLYDRIISEYNEYRKAPEALFLKGYVYENNLGRLDKAEAIYKEFLAKYPDNEFADDAEVSLKYLGKSPEELIEIFQKENAEKQGQEL